MDLLSILNEDKEIILKHKDDIIKRINEIDNVLDMDVIFVKRLTKASTFIYEEFPDELESLLEKLYRFNKEGATILEKNHIDLSDWNKQTMRAHFYNHAGDYAESIWKKTNDLKWAKKSFYDRYKAGLIINNSDTSHSSISFLKAEDMGYAIYNTTKDIGWVKRSLKALINVGKYKEFTPINYNHMAKMSRILYDVTKEEKWLDDSLKYQNQALDKIDNDIDKRNYMGFLGDLFKEKFNLTNEKEYGKEAFFTYIDSTKLVDDEEFNSFCLTYAADVALNICFKFDDIDFGKRAHSLYFENANIVKKYNKKHSAYTFGYDSKTCNKLFNLTNNVKWLKKAYNSQENAHKLFLEIKDFKQLVPSEVVLSRLSKTLYWNLSSKKDKIEWAKKVAQHNENLFSKAGNLIDLEIAKDFNNKLFNHTNDVSYGIKAYELHLKSIEFEKKNYYTQLNSASRMANKLFMATRDIKWKQKVKEYDLIILQNQKDIGESRRDNKYLELAFCYFTFFDHDNNKENLREGFKYFKKAIKSDFISSRSKNSAFNFLIEIYNKSKKFTNEFDRDMFEVNQKFYDLTKEYRYKKIALYRALDVLKFNEDKDLEDYVFDFSNNHTKYFLENINRFNLDDKLIDHDRLENFLLNLGKKIIEENSVKVSSGFLNKISQYSTKHDWKTWDSIYEKKYNESNNLIEKLNYNYSRYESSYLYKYLKQMEDIICQIEVQNLNNADFIDLVFKLGKLYLRTHNGEYKDKCLDYYNKYKDSFKNEYNKNQKMLVSFMTKYIFTENP